MDGAPPFVRFRGKAGQGKGKDRRNSADPKIAFSAEELMLPLVLCVCGGVCLGKVGNDFSFRPAVALGLYDCPAAESTDVRGEAPKLFIHTNSLRSTLKLFGLERSASPDPSF